MNVGPDLTNFVLGALLNLVFAVLITRFIYYPGRGNREYVFAFLGSNVTVYFVMSLLTRLEIGVGVGFGLFALFSILRYRTDELPIREMTYLFVLMALPVFNSVLATQGAYWQLGLSNGFLVAVLFVLEKEWGFRFTETHSVRYDNAALCSPLRRQDLLEDLRARTGLPVRHVTVKQVDLLHDSALLQVHYYAPGEHAHGDDPARAGRALGDHHA